MVRNGETSVFPGMANSANLVRGPPNGQNPQTDTAHGHTFSLSTENIPAGVDPNGVYVLSLRGR